MFGALFRCFASSTFLSGVLALVGQIVAHKLGFELPDIGVAAVPLAVGLKEGQRYRSLAPTLGTLSRMGDAEKAAVSMLGSKRVG